MERRREPYTDVPKLVVIGGALYLPEGKYQFGSCCHRSEPNCVQSLCPIRNVYNLKREFSLLTPLTTNRAADFAKQK